MPALDKNEAAAVARIQSAFDAFSRPPDEALRIRRYLTLYMCSLVEFRQNEHPSHLQMCVPTEAEAVVDILDHFRGVRRRYLEQVRANIKARKAFDALKTRGHCRYHKVNGEVYDEGGSIPTLSEHLRLLRLRKRHEELKILHCYQEKIHQMGSVKPGLMKINDLEQGEEIREHILRTETSNGLAQSYDDDVRKLTRKLEIAVLTAKRQLDRERNLLAQVKVQQTPSQPSDTGGGGGGGRLEALVATRNELVRWLEERLSVGSTDVESSMIENNAGVDEPFASPMALHDQIMAQYHKYVLARKGLLDALSVIASPMPEAKRAAPLEVPDALIAKKPFFPNISSLPFIDRQLRPLLQQQEATMIRSSYMSKALDKANADTMSVLERLSDESHLLAAYPLVPRRATSRHAPGTTATPPPNQVSQDRHAHNMVGRCEAWAFAAKAGSTATDNVVKRQLMDSDQALCKAEATLTKLRGFAGSQDDQMQSRSGESDRK